MLPLHTLLLQSSQYNMPIYITETGIADRSDVNRSTMIDAYMRAVRGAQRSAAPGHHAEWCLV
jgi:hypothetical protein